MSQQQPQEQPAWGYSDADGPSNWAKKFPKAAGEKQSPVDIVRCEVQQDPFLTENPLRWTYTGLKSTSLLNTGSGWRVDVSSPGPNIRGGPLHHNYQMVQFHSHWGTCSETGTASGALQCGHVQQSIRSCLL
ncbi:hypothetical protein MTO96_009922 [Rhipicephalus appendiculatus]